MPISEKLAKLANSEHILSAPPLTRPHHVSPVKVTPRRTVHRADAPASVAASNVALKPNAEHLEHN